MFDNYPDWYKVEKETEKTVKKLTNIKELVPYLGNSDEFIRRLAILRINELRLKDSIVPLKELLDDPLESTNNKELAAWTIRVISLHWNTDLFITNKYLNKYSGKERYSDVCKVTIKDSLPTLKFSFSSSLVNSELKLESNDIRSSRDMEFDLSFSIKEWFLQYSHEILDDLKQLIIKLPFLLFFCLKRAAVFIFMLISGIAKFSVRLFSNIAIKRGKKLRDRQVENVKTEEQLPKTERIYDKVKNYNNSGKSGANEIQMLRNSYNKTPYGDNPYIEKPSITKQIRKTVFYFFYILFSPLRLARQNKKVLAGIIIAVYCFFTFTTQGKIIMYKHTGLDLMEEQIKAINTTQQILAYAWSEVEDFLEISKPVPTNKEAVIENENSTDKAQAELLQYKVSTDKGLNLRQEPNTASAKVALLPYNSIVTYVGESKDTPTGTWHKLVTAEGKTGWASSNFLVEIGGIQSEGH
jgi:hypothetical protein